MKGEDGNCSGTSGPNSSRYWGDRAQTTNTHFNAGVSAQLLAEGPFPSTL